MSFSNGAFIPIRPAIDQVWPQEKAKGSPMGRLVRSHRPMTGVTDLGEKPLISRANHAGYSAVTAGSARPPGTLEWPSHVGLAIQCLKERGLMNASSRSIWEVMQSKGYSRRDFLQFCGYAAMVSGLASSHLGAVAQAFEKKARPPVLWMHFQECTCCSESFIRSSHPIVADVLLYLISLDYTETLQAAAGFQAEKCLHDTIKNYPGQYILLVEGSVPVKNDGVYCCVAGKTAEDILQESAKDAAAVIAWGSCASNGCIRSEEH